MPPNLQPSFLDKPATSIVLSTINLVGAAFVWHHALGDAHREPTWLIVAGALGITTLGLYFAALAIHQSKRAKRAE